MSVEFDLDIVSNVCSAAGRQRRVRIVVAAKQMLRPIKPRQQR